MIESGWQIVGRVRFDVSFCISTKNPLVWVLRLLAVRRLMTSSGGAIVAAILMELKEFDHIVGNICQ